MESEKFSINVKNLDSSPLSNVQNVKKEQDSVDSFSSPTPEKITQPIRSKSIRAVRQLSTNFDKEDAITGVEEVESPADVVVHEALEIPERYNRLGEFFDRMDTSISVLLIRKHLPTFQKISSIVETLTKRKLSYSHLAQMKYLLPEELLIEKILTHDEKTLCMKPDLKVNILKDLYGFGQLRKIFRERLVEFINKNPEQVSDIPEAMLPLSVTQDNELTLWPSRPESSKIFKIPFEREPLQLAGSCLGEKKVGSFIEKNYIMETRKTELLSLPAPVLPINSDLVLPENTAPKFPVQLLSSPERSLKFTNPHENINSATPQLAIATPSQPTPTKISCPITDEKIDTATEKSNNSATKRVLDFSLSEGNESNDDSTQSMDIDLSGEFGRSILWGDNATIVSNSFLLKVAQDNNVPKINQGGRVKYQAMLTSLTESFHIIDRHFQSAKYKQMTKEELLHKIISDNLDLASTREAEKQLELLVENLPRWISRTLSCDNQVYYSVKKIAGMGLSRAVLTEKLMEAVEGYRHNMVAL